MDRITAILSHGIMGVDEPTMPAPGTVWSGAGPYGYAESPIYPTRVEPAVGEVLKNKLFGDPSSPQRGKLRPAPETAFVDVFMPPSSRTAAAAAAAGAVSELRADGLVVLPLDQGQLMEGVEGGASLPPGTLDGFRPSGRGDSSL
jgi:hypothetical protein